MLVTGVQQSDSVISMHISILSQILFPYRLLEVLSRVPVLYRRSLLIISYTCVCVCAKSLSGCQSGRVGHNVTIHTPPIKIVKRTYCKYRENCTSMRKKSEEWTGCHNTCRLLQIFNCKKQTHAIFQFNKFA